MGVSSDDRWNDGPRGKDAWRRTQSRAEARLREPTDAMKRIERDRSRRIVRTANAHADLSAAPADKVRRVVGHSPRQVVCPTCGGKGMGMDSSVTHQEDSCPTCDDTGYVSNRRIRECEVKEKRQMKEQIMATENFKVMARKADEPGSSLRWLEIKSIEDGDEVMSFDAGTMNLCKVTRVIPCVDKPSAPVIGKTE